VTVIIPSHDEKVMPITLGHVLRTPCEDWPKYGIKWHNPEEFNRLVEWGRGEYTREWAQGDESQHEIVAEASRKAFGGKNNNQILREKTGKFVAKHLEMQSYNGKRIFYVLDVGAGAGDSFIALLGNLPKDFKGEIRAVLLDPAAKPLRAAGKEVKDCGIEYVKTIKGRQDQIPELVPKYVGKTRKMDVVMQVGSIHHDCNIPFQYFYDITEEDGIFASGDWHPQTWQDPAYVLKMLETNWPEYEEAIENFKKSYGVEKSKLPEDKKDAKACTDIFKFWKAYHEGLRERGGDDGSNSIWPLESHQDFRRYLKKMKDVGYSIKKEGYLKELLEESGSENPNQFYPDSTIIMGNYGHKIIF